MRITIQEVIDDIDSKKPNSFTDDEKKLWLSQVDGKVYTELFMTHEYPGELPPFTGYDQDTPPDTELLIPYPYTDVYKHYLASKMDLSNAELQKYANDHTMYNAEWTTFSDYWTRTHPPLNPYPHFML